MRAIIRDNQWIWLDNITDAEEEILWIEFSVTKPGIYIDPAQRGNWDGIYRKYNRVKKRLARPLLSMLRKVCHKHNLPLSVIDKRPKWPYNKLSPQDITEDFLPGIKLHPHQIRSIQAACKIECGIADIPTGGGKGEIIAGICKAIDCPTAIIADQRIVVAQLKERLELRDVSDDVGLFYAGEKPNGQRIVVGTIQSLIIPSKAPEIPKRTNNDTDKTYEKKLNRWDVSYRGYKTRKKNAKILQQYIRDAEMILVDECVHEHAYINLSNGLQTAGSLYEDVISGKQRIVSVGGEKYNILSTSEKYDNSLQVTTERGRSLITSENHPYALFVRGRREDVYAKHLRKGQLLLINDSSPQPPPFSPFWYFVGLFIGDGHLQNYRQIKFGVRKDFDDWQHNLRSISVDFDAEYSSMFNRRGDLVIRLKSRDLVEEIRSLGFEPGRKMGSINPIFDIPSDSSVTSILSGLFDAEGCSYDDHVNFDSSDKPLAEFVQILLSSIGIKSSLYVGNKRNNDRHATGWRVSITGSDVASFYNLVGFRFSRKQKQFVVQVAGARYIDPRQYLEEWLKIIPTLKLASILGCHHTKLAPSNDSKVDLHTLIEWQNRIITASKVNVDYECAKRIYGISHSKIGNLCGVSTATSWNRLKNGDTSLMCEYISDIQQRLSHRLIEDLTGFAVEPVDTIKSVGKCRLIDFTVDKISSFEANGIVVHNCDKATSDPFKNLFRYLFKGRRRYGFSGTPFDDDKPVEGMVMQEHLGSVIATESRQELQRIGQIIPIDYYMLSFGLNGNINDKSAYDIAYNEWLVDNCDFHKLIANVCKRHRGDGTLILVDRERLGHNLENMIRAIGLTANFIYGKTNPRARDDKLRSFERREYDVLIGGKIINRGLDLSGGCENLIIATGGKLSSDFIQKIGRAVRHNKRGESRVYDFLFRCNRYLYDHSRAHLKAMIAAGYKTTIVLPGGTIDGAKFVNSRFRIPKKLLKK